MTKIVFIGPQASGKGTQAKILSQNLNIPHISMGDLLREIEGELKEQTHKLMNQGKMIPDDLTLKIIKERIEKPDCNNGFILDGFPRNINQANLLKNILKIDKIIEITLSDEEAIKRISGRVTCKDCKEGFNTLTAPKPKKENICDICEGELIKRADDNEEAVKKRLEIYHKDTEPILTEYNNQGIDILKINGEQTIEKISQDIKEKVN